MTLEPGGRKTSDSYQIMSFILHQRVENEIPLEEHTIVSTTNHSILDTLALLTGVFHRGKV